MLESKIEKKLTEAVKTRHGMAPKLVSPGMAGMPDRIILLPDGHFGFIEVKAPRQKPRLMQIKRHEQLAELGYKVFVLDNEKQIKEILDAIQAARLSESRD